MMERRILGKTGLEVSCLGFGGFHLLEIPVHQAESLLNAYLDQGGNYIETALNYGAGESERKIRPVMQKRRSECILVSKSPERTGEAFRKSVEKSLDNLGVQHLDIILMHAVKEMEELQQILAPDGAFAEAQKMIAEGKVGHVGISMHGQPDVLIEALKRAPFEVVMTTLNYYDIHNFPKLLNELVPLAQEKNVGIILMKPLADGLLYRNADDAFRYALSLPVSVVVTGINTADMLDMDLRIAEQHVQLPVEEMQRIQDHAPELGTYVCRQCGQCRDVCPEAIDIEKTFQLEGLYDRQMRTGQMMNTAEFALRDRLRFWFGGQDRARKEYQQVTVQADQCTQCGQCSPLCPFGIDIPAKLKLADYKLANRDIY